VSVVCLGFYAGAALMALGYGTYLVAAIARDAYRRVRR
jgi:hypothetical protein